jgi:hypothetical protein
LEFGRPFHVWLRADETSTTQPSFDPPVICLQNLRIDPQVDPERLVGAFILGLDRLGREPRVGRDEADGSRNNIIWRRIEDNPRFISNAKLASVSRGQKNGHVNIGQIDDRYDWFARRYGLARLR